MRRCVVVIGHSRCGTQSDVAVGIIGAGPASCSAGDPADARKKWAPARWVNLPAPGDRKSTRLNSSHLVISYAVFCLKKKKTIEQKVQHRKRQNKRDKTKKNGHQD